MKKIRKVTITQLQTLIQEEVIRQKRIFDLESKKEEIVSQLKEMYELEGEVEEGKIGDFFKGSHDKWREQYINWVKQMQARYGEDMIPMPQGQDLEDAVAAARKYGEFRVVKRGGKWVPTHHVKSDVGSGFDGSGTA